MLQGLLAVGVVVWFGVAGMGIGLLLDPLLHPFVRRGLRAVRVADGRHHPEPANEEVDLWTRRWSRMAGFVVFFAGAVAINVLPVSSRVQRVLLVSFAAAPPVVGYLVGWARSRRRG